MFVVHIQQRSLRATLWRDVTQVSVPCIAAALAGRASRFAHASVVSDPQAASPAPSNGAHNKLPFHSNRLDFGGKSSLAHLVISAAVVLFEAMLSLCAGVCLWALCNPFVCSFVRSCVCSFVRSFSHAHAHFHAFGRSSMVFRVLLLILSRRSCPFSPVSRVSRHLEFERQSLNSS